MTWKGAVAGVLLASAATAQPVYEDKSAGLPDHIYSGGWEHFVGGGLAVFDCNRDGRPDVFAAGGDTPAKMLRNDGDFQFSRIEFPELTGATGAYPLDIDADGILDLFVLRVGPNVALKGNGGCGFEDATQAWGLPEEDRWSTAFSAWWPDGAQRPTMAVGNYVDRSDPDGPFEACDRNTLLVPEGDIYRSVPLEPGFCPLSILAARDARGRTTLRISNDRHYYVTDGYEQMWDIAESRFLGPEDGWQRVSLWGMGIASRDLDSDGRDEVMLTSMGDQVMQLAQPDGTYKPAPYGLGTYAQRPHVGGDGRPSTGWHAEFGDINNDTRADLFIAKGNVDQMPGMATRDPNNLLIQGADGIFTEMAAVAGVASQTRSRGGALADFDGDGLLDLIVSNRRAPLELYRNKTPGAGNWVRISLAQPERANRNAIGAVITVETPDGTQQNVQHVIGGGHAGGQLLPRHFGLAGAPVAKVSVTWPDGSITRTELAAGQTHLIERR